MRRVPACSGIGEAPFLVVDCDEALANNEPVGKGDDTRALLELRVGDESRDESLVDRADVAYRCPHLFRWRGNGDFLVDRGHRCSC